MYDKIGKKLKILAQVIFGIEVSGAVIASFALLSIDPDDLAIPAIIILLVGPLFAWISSWFLYGFGEIIDKLCDIERNTRVGELKSDAQSKIDCERIEKIERLRSQGLITEEEYKKAILK